MKTATLDTRQLLAFAAVARHGSFTLAAKELFLTQSAVSHAVKALEEDLGHRLLDRMGRRVHPTQAGEQLLEHVQRILGEMGRARSGLDRLSTWGQGRLRVGASETGCQYLLPGVLREFRNKYPKCTIRIEPGDYLRLGDLLRSGQVDVALMLRSETDRDLAFVPLFDDELNFAVAPDHPWAVQGSVRPEQVSTETLILYGKASFTYRLLMDYFRIQGISAADTIELGSMDAIKELAKTGVGVGVIAPWVARADIEAGALVCLPLGGGTLRREWGAAHLLGRRLELAEETFIRLCAEVTACLTEAVAAG